MMINNTTTKIARSAIILMAATMVLSAQVTQSVNVGTDPLGMIYDGSGNVWITHGGKIVSSAWVPGDTLTKVRVSDGAVLGNFTVGNHPVGVTVDGSGSIWVTNSADATVTKVASTGSVLGTYAVGLNPLGIVSDGTNIYIANAGDDTVTKLLASSGATVATFNVGHGPQFLALDASGNLWTTNGSQGEGSTVSEINATTGALVRTVSVGNSPKAICFDGVNMWVSNYYDGTITKILASSGATLGTYSIGGSSFAIAYDGSSSLWVSITAGPPVAAKVVNVRVSDASILSTVTTGFNISTGIAFDGAHVWVSTFSGLSSSTILPDSYWTIGTVSKL